METSLHSAVTHQLNHIIVNHLQELGSYISFAESIENQIPTSILADLERLIVICTTSPQLTSPALYEEACQRRGNIEIFLERMNQKADAAFAKTHVGRILTRANEWCSRAAEQWFQLPIREVWNLLAPVEPDHLEALGNGQYEARWWRPVPMMDIFILQRTAGITIHGEPFEPKHLPGGLAVRFSVQPSP